MTQVNSFTDEAKVECLVEFLKDKKYSENIDSLTGSNILIEYYDVFDWQQENNDKFNLFDLLISKPSEFIFHTKSAVKQIFAERQGIEQADRLDPNILIDKSELEINVNQAIKNKFVGKLISIKAMVNGESEIQTRMFYGVWKCLSGHETIRNNSEKPLKCDNEKCTHKNLEIDLVLSKTESYRILYLKEIDFTGHHSDTLIAEASGDLIDLARSGDGVNITGYLTIKSREKKLFNILHILNISINNKIDYQITVEDKKIYDQYPKQPNFYQKAIDSIAPAIFKAELNKEAILLSYVGASKWSDITQRNWINVLAVGDPATAKSKIAQWAKMTLPNVAFVSSKAGSAKGLFAGQKEQIDGRKVLEIGPMVSCSSRGILCIDEFARMSEVFDVFYSPMETGVFNSATVGGHADLPCETPVYATGNPKKSNRWDEAKSVIDNLQVFEPAMLSRFDLIIITKDDSTAGSDGEIARAILGIQTESEKRDVFNEKDFVKYLQYAKTFNPVLTNEVSLIIVKIFENIREEARKLPGDSQDITNRLVGTITRLTLAIARLHLHRETTEEDVMLARRLLENMLRQRGLAVSNQNTYINRISQKIITILEKSGEAMTDQEIHDALFVRFESEKATLLNDIGEEGPNRTKNFKWRSIIEDVEKSYLVTIQQQKNPRRLQYKTAQKRLDQIE